MRLKCPHCGCKALIRTSKDLSEITRELQIQCLNIECSHTWVAVIEAVRTIAPSMTPNPDIHIPLSQHAQGQRA